MSKELKANKAWIRAIKIVGGATELHKKSGIRYTTISIIKNGRVKDGEISYKLPTPEQAIKVSLLTGGKIKAEQLRPGHDFSYIYEYVEMMKELGK